MRDTEKILSIMEKARELEIPVITEAEFLAMADQ